jgi:ATP-binding cassette subfamily B protein
LSDSPQSPSFRTVWKARWTFIRPSLGRYKVAIGAGWFFVLLSTALDQAGPWMVKLIIEHLESGGPKEGLIWPLGGLLLATALAAFMLYFQRLWLIQASRKMEYTLRKDLFAGLMAQPKAFFDSHTIGDLMSRATNDLDRIRDLVGPVVLHLARMGCLVIYSAICLALLDPRLLLTGLLPALIMPMIANVFLRRMYALFGRIQKSLSSLNGFVQDSLTGIQVVKAFGREDTFSKKFEAASEELRDASLKVAAFNAAIWPAFAIACGRS